MNDWIIAELILGGFITLWIILVNVFNPGSNSDDIPWWRTRTGYDIIDEA